MKVAVFVGNDETIILQVKGKEKDWKSIDGFEKWFGKDIGRGIRDYAVYFQHIGSGEGVCITTKMTNEWAWKRIDDWFEMFNPQDNKHKE